MKVTRKQVIIGVLVIAVAVIIFIIVRKKMKEKKELDESSDTNTTVDPANIGASTYQNASVFPLKRGSKGIQVRQLQTYLLKEYGFKGAIDGDFGPITEAAVIKNLNRNNVSEDIFKKFGMDRISVFPKVG
jgi:hypothetical protein